MHVTFVTVLAADSVDEPFYRNLIGRAFGIIDALLTIVVYSDVK